MIKLKQNKKEKEEYKKEKERKINNFIINIQYTRLEISTAFVYYIAQFRTKLY